MKDDHGTTDVARGDDVETKEITVDPKDAEKVDYFLKGGPQKHHLEERLANSKSQKLPAMTDLQKHHFSKRKRPTKQLERLERKRLQAAIQNVQATEILQGDQPGALEAESELERTTAVTQSKLRKMIEPETAQNMFDLTLGSPPYCYKYDQSGEFSLLAGHAGHVAILNNTTRSAVTEFHLQDEIIRDATFLHNYTLHALAQRNHVYIYDQTGAEIHHLSDHTDPIKLEYLPYHWLLASMNRAGWLKYQDTSTGQLVSTHRTKLGTPSALRHNPTNAVLAAGHSNGCVTLWSPASSGYLAKILCHKGAPVTSLVMNGHDLVTAGMDQRVRIFDMRTFKVRHSYFCRGGVPTDLDLSQRGLLAVAHGSHVTIWKDALEEKQKSPYMHHLLGAGGGNRGKGPVHSVRFRPFEDVCGIGHQAGVSSIVVPGSGEPYIDTSENYGNDTKQRREFEVRSLLDKLSPDMIGLDADRVGSLEEPEARLERLQETQDNANYKKPREKAKRRGRSKIQTKLNRKRKNIIDQTTMKIREAREKQQQAAAQDEGHDEDDVPAKESAPSALKRFY